ncbi:MAG: Sec-independent protein translocase protein TatB [Thermodesulforhabdaceae bacterium]
MFDIGFQEIIVILLVALIVVGPKNLPQVGRALGRAFAEFRRAMAEVKDAVESNEVVKEFKEEYEKARSGIRKIPEEYTEAHQAKQDDSKEKPGDNQGSEEKRKTLPVQEGALPSAQNGKKLEETEKNVSKET